MSGAAVVGVADHDLARARDLAKAYSGQGAEIRTAQVDARNFGEVVAWMRGFDAVLSAAPYRHNLALTRAAISAKTHFADLGGNSALVDEQLALHDEARAAGVVVLPDLGVAPGLAGLLGADLVRRLDGPRRLHLRVGGIPREPRAPLGYRLVFSVSGLINEYTEPCRVIRGGHVAQVPALSEPERIVFSEPFGELEAFQTSGGTSTLVDSLTSEVVELDYKTIRYPGHRDQIQLLADLGFFDSEPRELGVGPVAPRQLTERLLTEALGETSDDVLLLRVIAHGQENGLEQTLCEELVVHPDAARGLSAMARSTGYTAALITAWLGTAELSEPGVHRQENVVSADRVRHALRERGLGTTLERR